MTSSGKRREMDVMKLCAAYAAHAATHLPPVRVAARVPMVPAGSNEQASHVLDEQDDE